MSNIFFEFNGGLGNQIFQFLASKYLQKEFKEYTFKYYISDYLKSGQRKLEINKVLTEEVKIVNQKNLKFNKLLINKLLEKLQNLSKKNLYYLKSSLGCLNSITEKDLSNFYPEINSIESLKEIIKKLNLYRNSFINIIGYWQNPENYINNIENYQKYFKNSYSEKTIFLKNQDYISIHIRRGDYLSNRKIFNYYFSKFSPLRYILAALSFIPQEFKKLPIYIVTDDIRWVYQFKEIIENNYPNQIFVLGNDDPTLDWTILRNSKLNICANSTFSYSAAILNYKNISSKLRCIVPQWISKDKSSKESGWISLPGFFDL